MLSFLTALAQDVQPTGDILASVAVPTFVAAIGASSSWLSYNRGRRTAGQARDNAHATALSNAQASAVAGFSTLTDQLQEQLLTVSAQLQAISVRLSACEDDRAALRTELGKVQGAQEMLHRELERFRSQPS